VTGGPESIVVFGADVSAGGVDEVTVQLRVAGEASVLPAASVAFTAKVWGPTPIPAYDLGEVQLPQDPESSEHWKLEPLSLEVNPKLAAVSVVEPDGPELIVVPGAVVSAGGVVGFSGGFTTGGGVGGPSGTLEALRGLVPASTSAPSPKPSPSVSNLRGLVLVLCSSVQLLSPSRSGSDRR